jgi:uracil phosphoribosyltransferase
MMKKCLNLFLLGAIAFCSVSYARVHVIKSKLVDSYLTILRDKTTDCASFSEITKKLAPSLIFAVGEFLDFEDKAIETPCGPFQNGCELSNNPILIPVLRAGLSLLAPFREHFVGANCGFYGIKRDEKTALPSIYYRNVPTQISASKVVILETMLATGGTVCVTLDDLKEKYDVLNENIIVVAVICAQDGVDRLEELYPGITIVTCAVDADLNEKKYIVPGLGDFGDRFFGNDCEQSFPILRK